MKVKCEYCDNFIDDTEVVCPLCGAPNEHMVRSGIGVPKTIEELRAFAQSKNLPLRQMRFFLGEDIREPRAFGIYKDEGGNCIVYKNKSDGSRIIRYRGEDEAYAVNELYQKMRTEVTEQKAKRGIYPTRRSAGSPFGASSAAPINPAEALKKRKGCLIALLIALAVLAAIVVAAVVLPDNGYYYYENTYYYVEDVGGSWYVYDEVTETWSPCPKVREIAKNWRDYKIADAAVQSSQGNTYVSNTYYGPQPYYDYDSDYSSGNSYSYSWDSDDSDDDWDDEWDDDWDDDDWDWDSGTDWDSSYTDWDSDW